jgi:hypothetical protein
MSPILDLPEKGGQINASEFPGRLGHTGICSETAALTITWGEIAEEIAETLVVIGLDPDQLDVDLLNGMAREAQKALNDDEILSWREIVRSKIISMPEIEPFLHLPDIEDDEGPLTEAYENATQLGDEDYYWVDGGASADFFADF